ncbi:hypothetical protein [Lacticaseibacillus camelliae]|uniref:hypothetical protein n=1 Tax=Lacticaseibacillus camelliae TaxID=381742 RepID=UPI0006CF221F|nr:hypothetical protein [Lacticaseibacillus camelliae]
MDPQFTTIQLSGGGMTRAALVNALRERHVQTDQAAERLLQTMPVYPGERPYPIRLGLIRARDLGLSQGSTLPHIFQTAQHYGLGLVPLAAAAFLRLQWGDQPAGNVFCCQPCPQQPRPAWVRADQGSKAAATARLFLPAMTSRGRRRPALRLS